MRKDKVVNIEEALDLINNGDTISTSGFVGFGHAEGIFEDVETALDTALSGARKRFPRALVTQLGTNLRLLFAAMRD